MMDPHSSRRKFEKPLDLKQETAANDRELTLFDLGRLRREIDQIAKYAREHPEVSTEELEQFAGSLRSAVHDFHLKNPETVALGGTPGVRPYKSFLTKTGAIIFEKFQEIGRQASRQDIIQAAGHATPIETLERIFFESTAMEEKKGHMLVLEKLRVLDVVNHRLLAGTFGEEDLHALQFTARVAADRRFQVDVEPGYMEELKASSRNGGENVRSLSDRAGQILRKNIPALMEVFRDSCNRELLALNPGASLQEIIAAKGQGFATEGRVDSPFFERYAAAVRMIMEQHRTIRTDEREQFLVTNIPYFGRGVIAPGWLHSQYQGPFSEDPFINPWGQNLVLNEADDPRYDRSQQVELTKAAEAVLRFGPRLTEERMSLWH